VTTGSLERGFEHFTLNSSAVASEDYQSLSAGVAWNVGNIGAFSTEAAWARHQETWNDGEPGTAQLSVFSMPAILT
jgi:outer membrane usher protein